MDKGTGQEKNVAAMLQEVKEMQSEIMDVLGKNLDLQIANQEQYKTFVELTTKLIEAQQRRLKMELLNSVILFTVGIVLFYCIVRGVI